MEDVLQIKETEDTPRITFDKNSGLFELFGKSLPEDPSLFYLPVITWLSHYIKNSNKETRVVFNLVYFNTASAKQIFKIFSMLKELSLTQSVKIIWCYDNGDKDMCASGERFSKLCQMPIELRQN